MTAFVAPSPSCGRTGQFLCRPPICVRNARHHDISSPPRKKCRHPPSNDIRLVADIAPVHIANLRTKISELAGPERGLFGLDQELRGQIHDSIVAVEAITPTPEPTMNIASLADGTWRLLYTTVRILGRNRVRLAIGTKEKPGFISLGHFYQTIDSSKGETQNIVAFDMAFGGSGTFTLTADYDVVSETRVSVSTRNTVLEPQALESLLGSKVDLLLELFDPTGYLDITYLDDNLRIGRDDKGDIFVLERCNPIEHP